jgi:ABC-type sugar transport system ATPase subunit
MAAVAFGKTTALRMVAGLEGSRPAPVRIGDRVRHVIELSSPTERT